MTRWIVIALALLASSAGMEAAGDCSKNGFCTEAAVPAAVHDQAGADQYAHAAHASPSIGSDWVDCAREEKVCKGAGWGEIRFGIGDRWRRLTSSGDVACSNEMFGDPAPGVVKRCQRRVVSAPLLPADTAPIASGFNRSALIGPGAHNPVPSARPDVVGAFRFICTAGQLNYDDPILYPGRRGGSPHLHQWYGNTDGNYASTYASLRRTGESSCSNRLNRSAYWVPALMTAAGRVIQPDYLSIYYKRLPDDDPLCRKEAAAGCVGLPTGLRVVSGYDMSRMGHKQAENATFSHRCISAGRPSIHRLTLAEALSDCGGAGQIMSAIEFGGCWNGMLDSADHRSHVTHGAYVGHSYPECPKSHRYLIPELRQQIVYTIKAQDGEIWFASDRMNGIAMKPGSTFHADYMEGWDPEIRALWERQCIGKMLNCSDGELGNGTMLIRGPLTYKATTRLIEAPARP